MSEKKKVKINGFVFTDEAEAEQAKRKHMGFIMWKNAQICIIRKRCLKYIIKW